MIKEEERDFKPVSRGEGRCNRFLEWLEINVTRWNRKKQVLYIPEKYVNYYFGFLGSLAMLCSVLTLYGLFTDNLPLIQLMLDYVMFFTIWIFPVHLIMFLILVTFRRVRIAPYNPLETPLPV